MISSMTFFSLVGGEIIGSQYHQPHASNRSGGYILVGSIQSTSPNWWGFQYLQHSPVIWLCVSLVSFDCSSLVSVSPPFCDCTVCAHLLSHPTLCDPMDYIPPGSSVHEIPQARILE